MKFCTVCNNIYTMKINTENKNQSLKLICNNCEVYGGVNDYACSIAT